MAKRDIVYSNSKLEAKDEPVTTVRLVLLKDIRLHTVGKVTGKEYVFNGAGSQNDVDERDSVHLLSRVSPPCCGSNTVRPYFELKR